MDRGVRWLGWISFTVTTVADACHSFTLGVQRSDRHPSAFELMHVFQRFIRGS